MDKRTWNKVQDGIEILASGQVRWRWTKGGEFSVKLAYTSLRSNEATTDPMWGKVWKLKVPERCKVFSWLVLHKRLLTNASRFKRGLSSDSRCPLCQAEVEDLQHVFRDCPLTLALWKIVVPLRVWPKFCSLRFNYWFKWNATYRDRRKESEDWRQIFILTCWWIWRRRNMFIFEWKKVSNHMILSSVEAIRRSLQEAQSKFTKPIRQQRNHTILSQWQPPPAGGVTVNTDGAFSNFSPGVACGGVVRDVHGSFIKGFLFKGMEGDCLTAELWGCLHRLKMAWDLGYRQVILEANSADAIDLMKGERNDLHADRSIIEEIHCLMERDWRLEVRLISRWSNNAADHLAKSGLSAMAGFHVVTEPDVELLNLLVKDKC